MIDLKPSALTEAVCQVMRDVEYVKATGRNKQQGYTYTSDEDVLRAVQPAMAKAGLALIPVKVERANRELTTSHGNKLHGCDLLVTYRLRHVSGETEELQVPGSGLDTLEKGASKALTSCYKYALLQLFAIPTGGSDRPRRRAAIPRGHWLHSEAGKAAYARFGELAKQLQLSDSARSEVLRSVGQAEGIAALAGWALVGSLAPGEWQAAIEQLEQRLGQRG